MHSRPWPIDPQMTQGHSRAHVRVSTSWNVNPHCRARKRDIPGRSVALICLCRLYNITLGIHSIVASLAGPWITRSEPRGVAWAQARTKCPSGFLLSEIALNNVELWESCEGAVCKSVSKYVSSWAGTRSRDMTEAKPRDHTRVSVRVDCDARVGYRWATDSE
jgi:hypothetical protein